MPNPAVETYLSRAKKWPAELAALRRILIDCGLTEELKWGKPCYCRHQGKNVVILQEMRAFLAVMFFKGALLDDPEGVLESQGPNTRSAKRIRFTSVDEVARHADAVRSLVREAMRVEDAGRSVAPPSELILAAELRARLDEDRQLRAAFEALTPGRQREYNMYVSGAKKSETRRARMEKCAPKIVAGQGLRDR